MDDGRDKKSTRDIYDEIVIGAGAAGLFYAAGSPRSADASGHAFSGLILEKTSRAGQKLLMSGNGMCNITHGGSIKDFIDKYGENGRLIRSCLYKHNNIELMKMMERLGVPLIERDDGKVFPETMKSGDVLAALLSATERNGWRIRYDSEVISISWDREEYEGSTDEILINIALKNGAVLKTGKLVIACGGSSYPSTGSDGMLLDVLKRDLGVQVIEPRPALTPIYLQDFRFGGISGVSFKDVLLECGGRTTRGPMLITHKCISGPAVLHMSQYVKAGDTLTVNFIPDTRKEDIIRKLKSDAPGNSTGLANHLAAAYSLPKSFIDLLVDAPEKKMSMLGGEDFDRIAETLTASIFSVSGTGGWNDAMVTAGGVALESVDLRTMRIKCKKEKESAGSALPDKCKREKESAGSALPDIRIIGEVLDVNGDTGGYNLQFAYSSAMTAI